MDDVVIQAVRDGLFLGFLFYMCCLAVAQIWHLFKKIVIGGK